MLLIFPVRYRNGQIHANVHKKLPANGSWKTTVPNSFPKNRAEKENAIKLKIQKPEENIIDFIERDVIKDKNSNYANILEDTVEDSFKRLIEPSIEREIRCSLPRDCSSEMVGSSMADREKVTALGNIRKDRDMPVRMP